MKVLIIFFKKTFYVIISLFILYILALIVFPSMAPKVDKLTWVNFSTTALSKVSDFFWKLSIVKEDIDNSIDEVWTNTKENKAAKIEEIKWTVDENTK